MSATDTEPKLLPNVFWGDGGEYVIIKDNPGLGTEVYGPFFNDFVAREWSKDNFPEEDWRRLRLCSIQPPFEAEEKTPR